MNVGQITQSSVDSLSLVLVTLNSCHVICIFQLLYFYFFFAHRNHVETFKITRGYDDTWCLHLPDETKITCNNLTEIAKNIKTQSKQKLRLAPSEYGRFNNEIEHSRAPKNKSGKILNFR